MMDIRDHGGPFGGGKYRKGSRIKWTELYGMTGPFDLMRMANPVYNTSYNPILFRFYDGTYAAALDIRNVALFDDQLNFTAIIDTSAMGISTLGLMSMIHKSPYNNKIYLFRNGAVHIFNSNMTVKEATAPSVSTNSKEVVYAFEVENKLQLVLSQSSGSTTTFNSLNMDTLTMSGEVGASLPYVNPSSLAKSPHDGRLYMKVGNSSGPLISISGDSIVTSPADIVVHKSAYNGYFVGFINDDPSTVIINNGGGLDLYRLSDMVLLRAIMTTSLGNNYNTPYANAEKDILLIKDSGSSLKRHKLSTGDLVEEIPYVNTFSSRTNVYADYSEKDGLWLVYASYVYSNSTHVVEHTDSIKIK